jgi:hypothetical protein
MGRTESHRHLARGDRPRRPRRWSPSLSGLEARTLPSITIDIDYSFDTNNFFNTQASRNVLQAAANLIQSELNDHLLAIQPSGMDTWTAQFLDPSTGVSDSINNLTVPADTIIVYVGGRPLPGAGEAGDGSTGGFQATGDQAWLNTVAARGKAGALASTPTAFGPWGGSIAFDNASTNWFFGLTTSGLTSNQTDFFTVAEHELGHVLGLGTSASWQSHLSGGYFVGPATEAAHGGQPVPTDPAGAHWAQGTMSAGTPAVMDPVLLNGTRINFTPLDFAGLSDIGWVIQASSTTPPSVFQFSAPAYAAPVSGKTATITVTRTGGTGAASVVVSASNGTGRAGVDFNATSGMTLNFPAGALSETFTVSLLSDPAAQGNPTVNLALSSPSASGGASIGTVGTAILNIVESPRRTADDFDGDGLADLSLFRPSTAQWIVAPTGNGGWTIPSYGAGNLFDIPVPADYDGVGHAELAVYRPSTAQWFIGGHAQPIVFGGPGDIPVPADYDGVGHAEIAVYRPSTAQWFIMGDAPISFGAPNLDVPVPSDYNGVGHAELAVFRPTTAQWFIGGHAQPITYGAVNLLDIPAPGDYFGAGRAQLAVFRVSTGQWFIAGLPQPVPFGAPNLLDIPLEGVSGSVMRLRQVGALSKQAIRAPETVAVAQRTTETLSNASIYIAPGSTSTKTRNSDLWLSALEALIHGESRAV